MNINIKETIKNNPPSILFFNDTFTGPAFGYKNRQEYYEKTSCSLRIPNIKTPTLFMNSLDDPIVGADAIDYELFKSNPNTVLATNKFGGHLGYHQTIFSF